MYGKLSGNSIMPAPYYVERNGDNIFGYNLDGNSEMLLQDGYKPVVDSDTPPSGMKLPMKKWRDDGTSLIAYWVDEYVPPLPPTDDDIVATRKQLYATVSDPMFNSYDQGGPTTLSEAIASKAQIQFDNKKSDQAGMSLADFVHKVNAEYALKMKVSRNDLTYEYRENRGNDDVVVGDKTINLIRTTSSCTVRLPKIAKVQTIKIDNVSEDDITITANSADMLAGVNSNYILPAKGTVEFISDSATSNWDLYTAPLEIETGLNIEIETNPTASRSGATDIKFGRGFTGYTNPDKNGVVVEVQDTDTRPVSYYASLSTPEQIVGRGSSPIHRGVIWFDSVISAVRTNMMDIRRNEKSIGIQEYDGKDPNATGGTPYLTTVRISMRGKAPSDGFIELALLDKATGLPIKDENGAPLAAYKNYKTGDSLGIIRVLGVIKAKNLVYLQPRLATNFASNETIFMRDYTDGNSCFMVVALDGDEVSETLLKYELDTGEKILYSKRYLGELYSSKYLSSYDMPKMAGEAEQGETDADGSHLYNKYKMNVEIANGIITFSSYENKLCLFSWGKIFDSEITSLLRGQTVSVDAAITNPNCAFNIQMVKWVGTPDGYTDKIISDVVNDSDVFENNWVAVDKQFMPESSDRQVISKTFVVPDDAANVAFIITPIASQNPMELSVAKFVINAESPRTAWVIKGFKSVAEKQMEWRKDKATFWTPVSGLQSYRFSGTDTPNRLPIGKLKSGDIPADLRPWATKEGIDVGVENDLTFYDDANIEVNATINLRVNTLGEIVYFYLTNNGKEIQGSRVSYVMKEHTIDNEARLPTMKAKVQNGDLIGWGFQATTKNGAWLETDSVAYPLATLEITTEGAV